MRYPNPKTFKQKHPNAKKQRPLDPGFDLGPGLKQGGPRKRFPPGKKAGSGKPKKPKGLDPFFKKWDPNEPLRGKSLKREMNAAARLEFAPLERQLRSESAASADRANRQIPHWYQNEYLPKLAALRGESQAAYDKAGATIQADANQAGAQDAANRAAIAERLQKDAQLRGTAVDPNIDLSGAGAEAARRTSSNSVLGTVAGQGANQFAYLGNRQAIGMQRGREQTDEEHARGRKISADQRELASKKGDFLIDFLRNARGDERKFLLEKIATRLDKGKAGETARHNLASEQNTRRGQNITKRGQNVTAKQRAKDRRQRERDSKRDAKAKKKGKGKL